MPSLQTLRRCTEEMVREVHTVAIIDHEKLVNWIALGSLLLVGLKLLLTELTEIARLVAKLLGRSSTHASDSKS